MRAFHRYWFINRVYELEPQPYPQSAEFNATYNRELRRRPFMTLPDNELNELQSFWLFYRDLFGSLMDILIAEVRGGEELNYACAL